MDQKRQLVKNTIIIAIGKLSTQIISYLLLPLYTAKLAPSEYGNYDFVCTLSIFLCPIITLLMEESMFRFLIDAESQKQRKLVINQTILYTILGTIIFTIVAAIVVNVTQYEFGLVFILFVISNILIGLSNALARGLGEVKLYSLSNFILGISTIILNIFFILVLKTGAEGLLWANTIANSLTAFVMFIKLRLGKYLKKIRLDKSLLSDMIRYSVPLVPNSLSWSIINLSDRLMIIAMKGSSANGIYSMAGRFPNILNVVYSFFYTAWKESAAKIIKEDNKEAYYNSIYKDMKKFLFATVICLIAVMPFAFPIFINKAYDEAFMYIPILALAVYFSSLSSFFGGIFGAYKDTKIMGITTVVAAIINIFINLLLIPTIGLFAACTSSLIANLVVYFYRKNKLKKYLKLRELRYLGPGIILTVILICYYSRYVPYIASIPAIKWIVSSVGLAIAISYSIGINMPFIKNIKQTILEKIKIKKQNEA